MRRQRTWFIRKQKIVDYSLAAFRFQHLYLLIFCLTSSSQTFPFSPSQTETEPNPTEKRHALSLSHFQKISKYGENMSCNSHNNILTTETLLMR